jgi:hypothetical protein
MIKPRKYKTYQTLPFTDRPSRCSQNTSLISMAAGQYRYLYLTRRASHALTAVVAAGMTASGRKAPGDIT